MKIEKKKRLLSEIDELEKGEKVEEFEKKAKKIIEKPPLE